MNESTFSSNIKKIALIIGVIFAVYNAVVFALCGFSDHGASFWVSYIFMNIALISVTFCGFLLKDKRIEPRDWLLGYPFYKHCMIYSILEFICSVLFMALDYKDCPWAIAFSVQIVVFAIFIVLITSCFIAKEIIEDVQSKVKSNTSFIKMLLIDVEMIVEKANNQDVKNAFSELCDKVRYSDPMSSELLSEIENKLALQIDEANACISCNDNAGALESCKKALLLLSERNRKCMVLK